MFRSKGVSIFVGILCFFYINRGDDPQIENENNYTWKGNMIMCGITGYTGFNQAGPILLEGLKRLEYRGYDSAGMCGV